MSENGASHVRHGTIADNWPLDWGRNSEQWPQQKKPWLTSILHWPLSDKSIDYQLIYGHLMTVKIA
jgi:hypothetical protein